jgi:hypothetical protein
MMNGRFLLGGWVLTGCLAGAWAVAAAPEPIPVPSVPLPTPPLAMPHLPSAKGNNPLLPRLVPPETLAGSPLEPRVPDKPTLPAGERVRVPSVDVNRPVPLPLLGQPLSDRAVVEDVTGEASSAATVATPVPQRTQPTPFVRNNLPDPFELRRPVETRPPDEVVSPPAATPKLPR